ncbi:MAG: hypothetical protein JW940_07495 [Polyangiaceae bacterium]|nr:hypothetical protein [Polyangiaceae bacterium]
MTSHPLTLGLLAAGVLAAACNVKRPGSDPTGYYFIGHVRDGSNNTILTNYTLTLDQAEGVSKADIAKDGTYSVGPLKPGSDFTVTIVVKEGDYREFFASEPFMPELPATADDQLTRIYDAYVFPAPSALPSPAVTLELWGPHSTSERPSGTVRFTPADDKGTSALDLSGRIAGAIDGQVWANDADRLSATETFELEDGVVKLKEGALVYGVTYTATVFDIGDTPLQYQSFAFTAGIDGDRTIILKALAASALQLVSSSLDTGELSKTATVVFTFDRDIVLSPIAERAIYELAIDDGFSINSPNLDGDEDVNALYDEDHGTSLKVSGNQLTLSWSRDASWLETRDSDDPILSATYGNLDDVVIRAKSGSPTDHTLAELVGANSVTVRVEQAEAPPAD